MIFYIPFSKVGDVTKNLTYLIFGGYFLLKKSKQSTKENKLIYVRNIIKIRLEGIWHIWHIYGMHMAHMKAYISK